MFEFEIINKDESRLSRNILDQMYPNSKFESEVRELKSLKDIKWMLMFIVEGLRADNEKIVVDLIVWLKRLMKSLNIDESHIDLLFEVTKKVLADEYQNDTINEFLTRVDSNTVKEASPTKTEKKYVNEKEKYLNALLSSNKSEAQRVILEMISNNVSIEDIYLHVFTEAMRSVGELWHDGKISVGMEHYCTAVTQYIMSSLYDRIFSTDRSNKKIVACAVGSELHEMGIRMVTDIFELHGWDTYYLGANLPISEIIDFAIKNKPDILALSITMPYHLGMLKETVAQFKSTQELKNVKIIIGGLPFVDNPELANSIGADGIATTAVDGLRVANELLM